MSEHQSSRTQDAGYQYLSVLMLKARNLVPMDSKRLSDPYAVVAVGKTRCQTNYVSKNLHPVWKNEFTFAFDRDMRFIHIDVFDRGIAAGDFHGCVQIPLMELPANKRVRAWYPLGLRSKDKTKGELGDVLVELFTNVPVVEYARGVMAKVSSIPGLNLNLGLTPAGRPLILPPPNLELLEDVAFEVTLRGVADNEIAHFNGVLLLTNYRVLFLGDGLLDAKTENAAATDAVAIQVPIGNVLNAEVGAFDNGQSVFPFLTVRTSDGRSLQFIINREEVQNLSFSVLFSRAMASSPSANAQAFSAFGSRRPEPLPNRMATNLFAETMKALDQHHLEEGPPEVRMHSRLSWYVNNPWYTEHFAQHAHEGIVNKAPVTMGWKAKTPEPATNADTEGPRAARDEGAKQDDRLMAAWEKYDIRKELERLGVGAEGAQGWRITDINRRYRTSPSYPCVLAVPGSADDKTVDESARFRHNGRLPTMVWRNATNGVVLCRSAEPLSGAERSDGDKKLVAGITLGAADVPAHIETGSTTDSLRTAKGHTPPTNVAPTGSACLVVADCRSRQAAASKFGRLFVKDASRAYPNVVSVEYLEIANVGLTRKSYDQMVDFHCGADNTERYGNYTTQLHANGWVEHQRHLLACVLYIIDLISVHEQSVLIHCCSGSDHTATITSIVQLCLDPYFRMLDGFVILIEKEWLSFGHEFQTRAGYNRELPEQRAPVFRQFLETVWQVLQQMPHAFEFNEELLYVVWQHCSSGWFGTFLKNSERDREQVDLKCKTLSIWTLIDANRSKYLNSAFNAKGQGPIYPVASSRHVRLWPKLWSSWYNMVHEAAWAQRMTKVA